MSAEGSQQESQRDNLRPNPNPNPNVSANDIVIAESRPYIFIQVTDTTYYIQISYPRIKIKDSKVGTEFADHMSAYINAFFTGIWKKFIKDLHLAVNPQPILEFDDEDAKQRFIKTFNEGGYSVLAEHIANISNLLVNKQP